jgi:hypothetical protein
VTSAAPNRRKTSVAAAATNARKAVTNPPVASPCPARPARIGPVQPNPARR